MIFFLSIPEVEARKHNNNDNIRIVHRLHIIVRKENAESYVGWVDKVVEVHLFNVGSATRHRHITSLVVHSCVTGEGSVVTAFPAEL